MAKLSSITEPLEGFDIQRVEEAGVGSHYIITLDGDPIGETRGEPITVSKDIAFNQYGFNPSNYTGDEIPIDVGLHKANLIRGYMSNYQAKLNKKRKDKENIRPEDEICFIRGEAGERIRGYRRRSIFYGASIDR